MSDDTILAVINLWTDEGTLAMGLASEDQTVPASLTNNNQAHLDGLQRSIKCRGGLRNLSPEALWHLAWCVSTMLGYLPIDTRMMQPTAGNTQPMQSQVDGYHCLTRLFDTLAHIQRQMSPLDSLSSILDAPSFSSLRKILLRFHTVRSGLRDQKRRWAGYANRSH